jgi:hypothetical protein
MFQALSSKSSQRTCYEAPHYTGCLKISFTVVFQMLTVWLMLRKYLHLNAYKLSIVQGVERWIACTPLSVNVFVTFDTQ